MPHRPTRAASCRLAPAAPRAPHRTPGVDAILASAAPRHTVGSRLAVVAVILLAAAGCSEGPEHPALREADLPPPLPARVFASPAVTDSGHRLSPDGRKLIWIGSHWGRTALFIRDNTSGTTHAVRTHLGAFHWTPDGRWLLFQGPDRSGAENTHVWAIDTEAATPEPRDLTPWPGVRAQIQRIPDASPAQVLVQHNRRDRRLFDLYRYDLDTGKETVIATNPGDAVAAVTDASGALRGWQRSREAARPAREKATPLVQRSPRVRAEVGAVFRVLGRAADGVSLWALSNRGRERLALVLVHPGLGWERVVFEDPVADVSSVYMSRVSLTPLLAVAQPGHPRFEILDDSLRRDLAPLLAQQGEGPRSLWIVGADAAERRMVISISDTTSRKLYLLDRDTGKTTPLGDAVPEAMRARLAPMRPIALRSRDGLTLHGYLTLPPGVPASRLPMVLHVHGGPWSRTQWADPGISEDAMYAQFLASRGYAVLQVDFRGSTGYGKSFFAAAVGEFAGAMQDDLQDAVRWAVDQGIADPARIAIMGWSYGGYAALTGLTRTPRAYACGISINGPTDLPALVESFPAWWRVDLSMWHDFAGNPAVPADRGAMQLRSPLTHAAELERPVLIVQGLRDVRVRRDQGERMVAALRAAGKPVEYLPIEDMGHGTGWWVHRYLVLRASEDFLHRCLGGTATRFDAWDPLVAIWHRISR